MNRLVLIGALLAGACGGTDDRPRTLEYITDTILAPTCASAECHSAFKQQVGDQFDTVEAVRRSIVVNALVTFPDDVANPSRSTLIRSLTVGLQSILDPKSKTLVRMPYDAPIPDADVALIAAWIADGAHGAQCLANAQGRGCATKKVPDPSGSAGSMATVFQVVECSDGNVGAVVMDCPYNPAQPNDTAKQYCTLSTGNGQCVSL